MEMCDGDSHPLDINNLTLKDGEDTLVDVRRKLELLEPTHNLAPPKAQWEGYAAVAEHALAVTRILGKIASLPEKVDPLGSNNLRTSLLVIPSFVLPEPRGPHTEHLETIPTWALPPHETSIISHGSFFFVMRQEVFTWDGKLPTHE